MNDVKDIGYIHVLRILACFWVIVNHTHHYMLTANDEASYIHYCIGFSLCKMAVTIFIMISAILMLDKEYSYRKIIQLIKKVLVPLLCVTVFLALRDNGIGNFNLLYFINDFMKGPYLYPYWYVYMLIGFYFMVPFLQKMIKNFEEKDYVYFIIIFLLVPCVINVLFEYSEIRVSDFVFWSVFPKIIGIAVTGNYISKLKLDKRIYIASIVVFVMAFIGMFLSCYIPYCFTGEVGYNMDSWSSLPVVIMASALVYIVRYALKERALPFEKLVKAVSKTTFGVYLLHSILLPEIYTTKIIQNIFFENRIIGTLILEVTIFVISSFLVYLVGKIPFVKRYL